MNYHDLLDELRTASKKAQALACPNARIYGQQNRMEEDFLQGWTQSK